MEVDKKEENKFKIEFIPEHDETTDLGEHFKICDENGNVIRLTKDGIYIYDKKRKDTPFKHNVLTGWGIKDVNKNRDWSRKNISIYDTEIFMGDKIKYDHLIQEESLQVAINFIKNYEKEFEEYYKNIPNKQSIVADCARSCLDGIKKMNNKNNKTILERLTEKLTEVKKEIDNKKEVIGKFVKSIDTDDKLNNQQYNNMVDELMKEDKYVVRIKDNIRIKDDNLLEFQSESDSSFGGDTMMKFDLKSKKFIIDKDSTYHIRYGQGDCYDYTKIKDFFSYFLKITRQNNINLSLDNFDFKYCDDYRCNRIISRIEGIMKETLEKKSVITEFVKRICSESSMISEEQCQNMVRDLEKDEGKFYDMEVKDNCLYFFPPYPNRALGTVIFDTKSKKVQIDTKGFKISKLKDFLYSICDIILKAEENNLIIKPDAFEFIGKPDPIVEEHIKYALSYLKNDKTFIKQLKHHHFDSIASDITRREDNRKKNKTSEDIELNRNKLKLEPINLEHNHQKSLTNNGGDIKSEEKNKEKHISKSISTSNTEVNKNTKNSEFAKDHQVHNTQNSTKQMEKETNNNQNLQNSQNIKDKNILNTIHKSTSKDPKSNKVGNINDYNNNGYLNNYKQISVEVKKEINTVKNQKQNTSNNIDYQPNLQQAIKEIQLIREVSKSQLVLKNIYESSFILNNENINNFNIAESSKATLLLLESQFKFSYNKQKIGLCKFIEIIENSACEKDKSKFNRYCQAVNKCISEIEEAMNMENDNNMTKNKIKKQQALEILKKHMENIQTQVKYNKFKKSSKLVEETINNDGSSMKEYIIKNYYISNREILQQEFNNFQNTNKEENILNKKQQVVIKK